MIKKTVTIHQPDFIPWLGFFERWAKSDLYIALDDVQFLRRGWHHRDKIRSSTDPRWLTVPVQKKGNYYQTIKEVRIETQNNWIKKHLNQIFFTYKDAPQFEEIYAGIENIYDRNHEKLIDLNMDFLYFIAKRLDITTPVMSSSALNISTKSTQRLVDLACEVDAGAYLTGLGSQSYLDESLFQQNGITLCWQNFDVSFYGEHFSQFVPDLSILDLLMMNSPQKIITALKTNKTEVNNQC